MFFKRLLRFTEDQKIDIAAQKLQLGEFEEAFDMLKDLVVKQSKTKRDSLAFKLALSIFSKSGIRFAKKLEQSGKYNEALGVYFSINDVAPRFPDIHNSIAIIKMILADNLAAREHLHKAIELNPKYKDAYINMIKVMVLETLWDDANDYCKRLFDMVTGEEAGLVKSLDGYINNKKKENALKCINEIKNVKDDYTSLYLRLGIELFNKQRYKEAALELQKYLQYKPHYADVLHILGVCYMELKDHNNAIKTFKNCLEINKDFVLSRLHLAMSYKDTGEIARANNECRKVLDADPDNKIAARLLKELNERG